MGTLHPSAAAPHTHGSASSPIQELVPSGASAGSIHDGSSLPSPRNTASANSDGITSRSIQEPCHPSAASDPHRHLAASIHANSSLMSPHTTLIQSVNASHHHSASAAFAVRSPLVHELRADISRNSRNPVKLIRKVLERIHEIREKRKQRNSGSSQSPPSPTDPSPSTAPEAAPPTLPPPPTPATPPSPWTPTLTATCRWISGAVLALGGYALARYLWAMWQRRRRPRLQLQQGGG